MLLQIIKLKLLSIIYQIIKLWIVKIISKFSQYGEILIILIEWVPSVWFSVISPDTIYSYYYNITVLWSTYKNQYHTCPCIHRRYHLRGSLDQQAESWWWEIHNFSSKIEPIPSWVQVQPGPLFHLEENPERVKVCSIVGGWEGLCSDLGSNLYRLVFVTSCSYLVEV